MEEKINKELEKYYNLISNELDKLEKINKEKAKNNLCTGGTLQ